MTFVGNRQAVRQIPQPKGIAGQEADDEVGDAGATVLPVLVDALFLAVLDITACSLRTRPRGRKPLGLGVYGRTSGARVSRCTKSRSLLVAACEWTSRARTSSSWCPTSTARWASCGSAEARSTGGPSETGQ